MVLYFDKNYFPLVIPGIITWLFKFLSGRYRKFIPWETGINAVLLLSL